MRWPLPRVTQLEFLLMLSLLSSFLVPLPSPLLSFGPGQQLCPPHVLVSGQVTLALSILLLWDRVPHHAYCRVGCRINLTYHEVGIKRIYKFVVCKS